MRKFKKKGIIKLVMTHFLIFAMLISLFPLYSSNSFAIDYPTSLVNGGFEYPTNLVSTGSRWWTDFYPYDISGHSAGSYISSSGSGIIPTYNIAEFGWDTTATGANRVFEFGSDSNSPTADWGVKFVPEGTQFIELNAAEVSAAFQDIQTTPGQVIYWSFYQGGVWYTNKTDIDNTMAVRIGSPVDLVSETMIDANQTVYDQEWINRTIYEVNNMAEVSSLPAAYVGKDANKKEIYTEAKRWTKYEGIYIVPAGQTVTRFAFASRSIDDPLSGNLLDGVVFRTATDAEVGNLTYTVTFNGNESDGGSTPIQTLSKDETKTLTINGYTRTGYHFAGWNTLADGTGVNYADGASYTAVANITLYAKWVSDNTDIDIVGNAKDAANNARYEDMTQIEATSETIIENAIKASADAAINNADITTTVNKVNYIAPVAGTSANHAGINGKYEFTVTVQKGLVTNTTEVKQIVIVATPYVEITKYSISGKVIDETPSNVQGAIVKIMNGQNQVGLSTLTANDGTFSITDVLSGTYNLVISKGGSVRTKVITITNANFDLGTVELSTSKMNSIVEVKSNTPSIVVGGLDDQFDAPFSTDNDKGITSLDNDVITNGGSVEIKLIADKKDSSTNNASNILATASSNGKTVGIFLDLSVLKTVKDNLGANIPTQSTTLSELPSLIEVLIPLDNTLLGKSYYVIYRYHGSAVDSITTTANSDGEKIELIDAGNTLKLTLKKFSTYAVAYTSPVSNNEGSNTATDTTVVSPQITVIPSEGGKINISIDKKNGAITPADGYVIADVIVDEKRVGATENYTFTDNKSHKISAVFVKISSLPYYLENGEKVYIGLSAVIGNTYRYIAPKDVTVLFSENIKNFKDNTVDWSKSSIDFITERELLAGTSQELFSPKVGMTRGMFVTAIGKLYENSYGTITGQSTFSDVDSTAYYAKYVAWANENGIVTGIGDNKFEPDRKVTREQISVIMLNFAKFLDMPLPTNISLKYSDQSNISSWAIEGAKYCQENNLITGKENDSFKPQSDATRSEVAVILERFIIASFK